jgi:hypothetical protein
LEGRGTKESILYTELDIELCAIKLNLLSINVIITRIYRSSTGYFKPFLNKLENILNSLRRNKNEIIIIIIICGDINVNYLVTSHRTQQLDMLLSTYTYLLTYFMEQSPS